MVPSRRHLLRSTALLMAGLAGCSSFFDGSQPEEPTPARESPTATATETGPVVRDIRDYGAKVDGSTDDTQAVMDAINAASPGDTVLFPEGTTVVFPQTGYDAAIEIDHTNGQGITLAGTGPSSVVKMKGGVDKTRNSWVFGVPMDRGTITGLEFRDFVVDGNKKNNVRAKRPGRGNPTGFNFWPGGKGHRISIRNVTARNCGASGFRIRGSTVLVDRCTSVNNDGHGFGIGPWYDTRRPGIVLTNVLAENNVGLGVDHNSGVAAVDGFWCENNGQGGMKVPWPTTRSIIKNGTFRANTNIGFRFNGDPKDQKVHPMHITLDNIVSEDHPWTGFSLGGDVKYDIGTILSRRNNSSGRSQGNIDVLESASLNADRILSYDAASGFGLFYNSSDPSEVDMYIHAGNAAGFLNGPSRRNLSVSNIVENVSEEALNASAEGATLVGDAIESLNVPLKEEVGANSMPDLDLNLGL